MSQANGEPSTLTRLSRYTTQSVGAKTSRSLHLTAVSCVGNVFVGMGKLIMGIVSLSPFACASALYTFGMLIAKLFALTGIVRARSLREQHRYYFYAGLVLTGASLAYIIYSMRQFLYPRLVSYHLFIVIGIAAFSFTELVINLRGVILERHNRMPLVRAIKLTSLASALICLVLTQAAILSFTSPDAAEILAPYNGALGMLMGVIAGSFGVYMIRGARKTGVGRKFK